MGAIPHNTVTNRFLPTGENKTLEAPGAVFDPTIGEKVVETPLPNNSSKASISPTVSPPFFQKRLAHKQLFIQCIKHYHQWLRTAIPPKTKLGQISSDYIRTEGPSKTPSIGRLHPVSSVKERYRKGGKCKISRILQSLVSSTQASPKVEASNRLK